MRKYDPSGIRNTRKQKRSILRLGAMKMTAICKKEYKTAKVTQAQWGQLPHQNTKNPHKKNGSGRTINNKRRSISLINPLGLLFTRRFISHWSPVFMILIPSIDQG
jgi:hypothetical protein